MKRTRKQNRLSILDDVWGRIRAIQLQFGHRGARLGPALAGIVRSFSADTRFIIATPCGPGLECAERGNVTFLVYDDVLDTWAQDRQIVLQMHNRHHVVPVPKLNVHFIDTAFVPRSIKDIHARFAHVDPRLVAERNGLYAGLTKEIAARAGCEYCEYDLGVCTMDGGDVVADERCVFVGKSTFDYNMLAVFWRSAAELGDVIDRLPVAGLHEMIRDGIAADDSYRRLVRDLRDLLKVKSAHALFGHLEVIHGVGRYFEDYKINEVIQHEAKTLKSKLEMYAGGRSVRFLAVEHELPQHVDMYLTPLGNGTLLLGNYHMVRDVVLREHVGSRGGGVSMADRIEEENSRYFEGMQTLREALSIDYDVVSVPYSAGVRVGDRVCGSIMPNNCLVECYQDDDGETMKNAYVGLLEKPYFSRARAVVNEMTKHAFERQGYTVIPVGGLHTVYEHNGSLRCIAKVLKRDRCLEY